MISVKTLAIFIFSLLIPFAGLCSAQDGVLLGNDDITIDKIYDTKNNRYKLLIPNLSPAEAPITNPSVITGLIDSGVLKDHPQLKGRILKERDFTGEGPQDNLGHGTIVALIGFQSFYSLGESIKSDKVLNRDLSTISAKVADRNGKIKLEHLIEAIRWLASNKVLTIGISLGFKGPASRFKELCNTIESYDILFTVAAGNEGPDVPYYPASCPSSNIISVGAASKSEGTKDFSGKADIYAEDSVSLVPPFRFYYLEGLQKARQGHAKEAVSFFMKSIEEEENPESYFQLGVIELHNNNPRKALDYLEDSLIIFPEFPEALEHLGLAYYLMGNSAKGEKPLKEAVSLNPQNARSHFNLAMVLWDIGKKQESLEELYETQRIDPNYPRLKEKILEFEKNVAETAILPSK